MSVEAKRKTSLIEKSLHRRTLGQWLFYHTAKGGVTKQGAIEDSGIVFIFFFSFFLELYFGPQVLYDHTHILRCPLQHHFDARTNKSFHVLLFQATNVASLQCLLVGCCFSWLKATLVRFQFDNQKCSTVKMACT